MSTDDSRLTVTPSTSGWTIAGEIDAHSAPALAKALSVMPDVPRVVADLADVSFMDSSGLRVLIDAALMATAAGKKFAIAHPQPAIKRVVEISGLGGHLHVVD